MNIYLYKTKIITIIIIALLLPISVNAQDIANINNTIYLPIIKSEFNSTQTIPKSVYITSDIIASSTDSQLLSQNAQELGIDIILFEDIQQNSKIDNASIIYLAPSLFSKVDSSILNLWKQQHKMLAALGTPVSTLAEKLQIQTQLDHQVLASGNQFEKQATFFMQLEIPEQDISGVYISSVLYSDFDLEHLDIILTRQINLINKYRIDSAKYNSTQISASNNSSLGHHDVQLFSDSWGNIGQGESWIDVDSTIMGVTYYDGYSKTTFSVAADYQFVRTETWSHCGNYHMISSYTSHAHGSTVLSTPGVTAGSTQCRVRIEAKGYRGVRTYPTSGSVGVNTLGYYDIP